MSSPAIGIETLPPEIRYATPMRDIPKLEWLAADLLGLQYGDFVEFCDGIGIDADNRGKVHEWALKRGT